VCADLDDTWVANVNSPAQTVISGALAGVEQATARLERQGARTVVRLPIPIACHTPLMEPAAEQVRAALAQLDLRPPTVAFYSSACAAPQRDVAEIARSLVDGITQPVLFAATVRRMRADGVERFLEVGPGRVLRGLLRENAPELANDSIASFHYPVST
jgi:[acyl-carrier-protein] S-malonyltransferase